MSLQDDLLPVSPMTGMPRSATKRNAIAGEGRSLDLTGSGNEGSVFVLRNRVVSAGMVSAEVVSAGLLRSGWPGLLILLALAATASPQDRNLFLNDPKAAEAGKSHFRINCSMCHGLGARGGGRGPDLTLARKKHGNSDAALFRTIHDGVPGTDMPAAMGSVGVEMKDQEIWQVITYLRSVEVKTPPPTGNAAHGKALFYGAAGCSKCHMVEGKGGRLGPDLTAVGSSRSLESIVESVRNPSQQLADGYQTVTVVTADGQEAKGFIMNEDRFSVQMMDTRERILLLERDKLRSFKKSPESLMPPYSTALLNDEDLQDIVAYLEGSETAP
jgi:cytochrome c oxidase cbb3-type subunit 3